MPLLQSLKVCRWWCSELRAFICCDTRPVNRSPAALLIQVPSKEDAPFDAVLTNVTGAENKRHAVPEDSVEVVVAISADKAVKPVAVMGMTKSLQEQVFLDSQYRVSEKRFFVCSTSVIDNRVSVLPLFHRHILDGQPLRLADDNMPRLLLTVSG